MPPSGGAHLAGDKQARPRLAVALVVAFLLPGRRQWRLQAELQAALEQPLHRHGFTAALAVCLIVRQCVHQHLRAKPCCRGGRRVERMG